jgi:excisionase family DNA binding protein
MIEANVPVMFDIKTVAKILSVSRSTVYQLLKSGELKAVRVGRVRRVSQNQLVEYIMKLEEKEDNWVLSDYSDKIPTDSPTNSEFGLRLGGHSWTVAEGTSC